MSDMARHTRKDPMADPLGAVLAVIWIAMSVVALALLIIMVCSPSAASPATYGAAPVSQPHTTSHAYRSPPS